MPSLPQTPSSSSLPTPALTSPSLRASYRIGRGEQGVLTFEPYKSLILPYWRFRTVDIARESSSTLKSHFDDFVSKGDFVGADMSRKFIQMGMTRARRYANYKGGRKYDVQHRGSGGTGDEGAKVQKEKSRGHPGMEEKAEASEIFKAVWRQCMRDEEYLTLKRDFQEEQKSWDKDNKQRVKKERGVKKEETDKAVKVKEEETET